MRHVTISKTVADLNRLEFLSEPVTSFYVSERGIEKVDYGKDKIPTTVAVFDPSAGQAEPVTLDQDPLRWAELLPLAYRTGDHQITVSEAAEALEIREPVATTSMREDIPAALEALTG